jgi:RNA polymerase sigma-70 factor (ECF subfamily)
MSAHGMVLDQERAEGERLLMPAGDVLAALLRRIQCRDAAALGELYDQTGQRLYALARKMVRSREDAEEVVFDVFTQVWNDAERYEPGRASVLGWMLMICRSRALDRLRQGRHTARGVDIAEADTVADSAPGPEDVLSLLEQGTRVHAALAGLPDDRRELLSLAFLRGLSHQEIADLKGLPLGTVKSHVRRSLLELRDGLDESAGAGKEPS